MDGGVLVVDDNVDFCRMFARLIQRLGFRVASATSGEDALTYLAAHKPDVLVLDFMMPGIDGLDVVRVIRSEPRLSNLPVILFTAVADETFHRYALATGATECWLKGAVDFGQLADRLAPYTPPRVMA